MADKRIQIVPHWLILSLVTSFLFREFYGTFKVGISPGEMRPKITHAHERPTKRHEVSRPLAACEIDEMLALQNQRVLQGFQVQFVEATVEDTIEVEETLPSDEFIDLSFFVRTHRVVIRRVFWRYQTGWGFRLRIFKQPGVTGSKKQWHDDGMLPVNDRRDLECIWANENIARGKILLYSQPTPHQYLATCSVNIPGWRKAGRLKLFPGSLGRRYGVIAKYFLRSPR